VSYKSAPTLAIDYWSLDAIFPGVLGESAFFSMTNFKDILRREKEE